MISNFYSTLLFLLSFAFTLAQSNNTIVDSLISKDNITFYQNIEYGKNERNNLDILIPKSNSKTPLVIYLHGGGYKGGKKENSYRKNNIGRVNEILNNKNKCKGFLNLVKKITHKNNKLSKIKLQLFIIFLIYVSSFSNILLMMIC